MTKENEFETYLYISDNKVLISDFSKLDLRCLYKDEINFKNKIDSDLLNKFLQKNVLKIEKMNNHFIKKINLIIDDNIFLSIDIGIKKIINNEIISEKIRPKILINLINELKNNYSDSLIIHFLINSYLFDDFRTSDFNKIIKCNSFSLEATCILIKRKDINYYQNILKKYQITIDKIISGKYLKSFEGMHAFNECEIGLRISSGLNSNEVFLIPKVDKNKGFFEWFFNLFS